jgi:hypothetical protein
MRWRHEKRGTLYTELGRARLQCAGAVLSDDEPMVVYVDDDGQMWVRSEREFMDGRFVPAEP